MNQFFFNLGLAALFVLFISCMSMLMALGGWGVLARKYRSVQPFHGKRWYFQQIEIRRASSYASYSWCLTVGANADGLYLAVWPIFRPGHPKLFIPWAETTTRMRRLCCLEKCLELQFAELPGIVIRLDERLARRIAGAVGPYLSC